MPRRYTRCKEKFMNAEYRLAVGEGDVRQRLRFAFMELFRLTPQDIPPSIVEEWEAIIIQLTQRGPILGPDGLLYKKPVDHTLSRMRNSTGRKIAERIYRLNQMLQDDAF